MILALTLSVVIASLITISAGIALIRLTSKTNLTAAAPVNQYGHADVKKLSGSAIGL